jgi:hypothetical protein
VFGFFLQLLAETFVVLRRIQRDIVGLLESTRSCQVLTKVVFSRKAFKTFSNIKFHENPSSGSRVVSCGLSERRDETNSRFLRFCESAFCVQCTWCVLLCSR